MAEDEYLVAADLTLYDNPLRVLTKKKTKTSPQGEKDGKEKDKAKPASNEKEKVETDVIAADLTKYSSPLDDLDNWRDELGTLLYSDTDENIDDCYIVLHR